MQKTESNGWKLSPGNIYRRELHKRIDERPTDSTAIIQRANLQGSELVFATPAARDQSRHNSKILVLAFLGEPYVR